jgi:hypothetical protein
MKHPGMAHRRELYAIFLAWGRVESAGYEDYLEHISSLRTNNTHVLS